MNRRCPSSDSGISLIETLVALAILAVGMLSLAQLFAAATALATTARHLGMASVYAAQKLEEIRSAASGPSLPSSGVDYLDRTGIVLDTIMGRRGTVAYTRQWSVRPLGPAARMRVVEVVAIPGEVRGGVSDHAVARAGQVRLVSLLAQQAP